MYEIDAILLPPLTKAICFDTGNDPVIITLRNGVGWVGVWTSKPLPRRRVWGLSKTSSTVSKTSAVLRNTPPAGYPAAQPHPYIPITLFYITVLIVLGL